MNGWICPKCGRVYAPFVMACVECNEKAMKAAEESGAINHSLNYTAPDRLSPLFFAIQQETKNEKVACSACRKVAEVGEILEKRFIRGIAYYACSNCRKFLDILESTERSCSR